MVLGRCEGCERAEALTPGMDKKELQQKLSAAGSPQEMIAIMDEWNAANNQAGVEEESIEQSLQVIDMQELLGGSPHHSEHYSAEPAVDPMKVQSINRGKAVVEFETQGRFGNPDVAYLGDYTHSDLTSLALCRNEDRLENVVFILDRIKNDPSWKIENLLIEEFFETLLTMKRVYNTQTHVHRWYCDCQEELPESEREASEFHIDIDSINYTSIQECDDKIRENYALVYNEVSDEEWYAFLQRRFPEGDPRQQLTRGEYVENLAIGDNISVRSDNGNVYVYRFGRVADIIKGMKIGSREWNYRLREIKKKSTNTGRAKAMVLYERSREIEDLEKKKAESIISATQGLSLVSFNGKVISSDQEKIQISRAMPRDAVVKLTKLQNLMNFGVNDERDFVCNLCGKTERGLLQRTISPLELLPIATESGATGSKHKPGDRALLDAFVC